MSDIPETDIFLGDVENPVFADAGFGDMSIEDVPEKEPETLDEAVQESGLEDSTIQIGDGTCIVCGSPTFRPPGLTKAGHKKRTPKYCDLHGPHVQISSSGPVSARMESQLQRMADELADEIKLGGMLIGGMFPVTGFYIFDCSDPFTAALVRSFKGNQKALRVMHRMATIAPIYEIVKDCAGLVLAIQVDQKKHDPHSAAARRLGVSRAYDSVYPSDTNGTMQSNSNNGTSSPPPPRYAGT